MPLDRLGLLSFGVAAFTDFLDGHLARKHALITNFGKLMDPVADKVLMASGFVMLVGANLVPAWVVVAILGREFLVTGIRLLATAQREGACRRNLGKHKTTWQIVTLLYFLAFLASADPLCRRWPESSVAAGRPRNFGRILLVDFPDSDDLVGVELRLERSPNPAGRGVRFRAE